jgi:hypothetical protein
MNRDEILVIARDVDARIVDMLSGKIKISFMDEQLVAFASRIESLVREKCAQVCESFCDGNSMTANELADIIRKSEG